MTTENVITVSDEIFQKEVLESKQPVLVDFWATWCGPCLAIAPLVDTVAKEFAGQVKVAKLDVDNNPHTAMQYNVLSIPTLIMFKDGKPVEKIVGAVKLPVLQEFIKKHS